MKRNLFLSILGALWIVLGLSGCAGLVSSTNPGPGSNPTMPSITTQPASQTVTAGQTATFTVAATGTAPLSYQWKKNGVNLTGATSSGYTTPATTTGDNGATFQVTVSNAAGSATSATATLTVNAAAVAPTITTQPASQTVTAGQTATFTVAATGTAPLSYQWKKNGVNLTGATSSSYTTATTTTGDNGATFQVTVSNAAGSVTSAAATLTVSADSTAPTVLITAPVAGATLSGVTVATATASDVDSPIAFVQFLIDGSNVGAQIASAPYTLSLDTTTLSNGSHTLTAIAKDPSGNLGTSAALSITVSNSSSGGATGPLRVLASNPRYFTDGSGKAIYLTGSHTWANLVDQGTTDPPPAFDYTAYLSFLQAHNHNFFRLWTWTLPHPNDAERPYSTPLPWLRVGPGTASDGKPQFDLNQFDQTYFDRLRSRIMAAQQQGIYVSIMLFEGFDLQFMTQSNDGDPFAQGNNVNGVSCGGTCPHILPQDATVTAIEQAYLRKVIDTTNDLDNVLYEVANEAGPYSTSWQYSIIGYVKQYEATKPKQHPAGMTFQYSGGTDSALYASPADWISPVDKLPPPADGRKVVINDTDHAYGWQSMKNDGQAAQQAWAWENFTIGNNTLFMDPYLVVWPGRNAPGATTVDPYWEVLRNALGRTRIYAQKMNLAAMTPQGSLSSTGFCLANAGSEYLIYQPTSGTSFSVNLLAGTYGYEWFSPSAGTIAATGLLTATGGNQSFNPPFSGDSVLYLKIQ